MTAPDARLHPADIAELAELLQFPGDWLASGDDQIHRSLAQFVGHPPTASASSAATSTAWPSCSARATAANSSANSKPRRPM
ncbi:MAG TPA: hypothetical protein VFO16_09175 [Pseudonocardiaceae bacterium]|nr:hypothetical protein [Pseudonocardiaceae bacterium]